MRSSTVLAVAAAVSAPTLAAALPYPETGSEALSLGQAWNIGKDGYDTYEAVKGAYDSWKHKNKRELEDISARFYNQGFRGSLERPSYGAQRHGFQARELEEMLARELAENHGQSGAAERKGHRHHKGHRKNLGTKAHGAVHPDAAENPETEKSHAAREDNGSGALSIGKIFDVAKDGYDAYEAWKNNHHRRSAADKISDGLHIVNDGANVATDVRNTWQSWHQGRNVAGDIDEGLRIVGDGANAVTDIHNAWDSFKNNHRRNVANDIDEGIRIVGDGANAVTDIHNAWESWHHRRNALDDLDTRYRINPDDSHAITNYLTYGRSGFKGKRRNIANDVETGIHIVGDGANAATAVHNAWESWRHHRRSALDELD